MLEKTARENLLKHALKEIQVVASKYNVTFEVEGNWVVVRHHDVNNQKIPFLDEIINVAPF